MTIIRPATKADAPLILELIRELADYEHLEHEVTATEKQLSEALFGENPAAEAILAYERGDEASDEAGTAVGFALYFTTFSTFLARRGIWLEDLYIRPAFRRRGHGQALLRHVAKVAVERGCGRMEWAALDWNTPATDFYKGLGAVPLEDWTTFRLTGDGLASVASGSEKQA